jgi:hypothetical protein
MSILAAPCYYHPPSEVLGSFCTFLLASAILIILRPFIFSISSSDYLSLKVYILAPFTPGKRRPVRVTDSLSFGPVSVSSGIYSGIRFFEISFKRAVSPQVSLFLFFLACLMISSRTRPREVSLMISIIDYFLSYAYVLGLTG